MEIKHLSYCENCGGIVYKDSPEQVRRFCSRECRKLFKKRIKLKKGGKYAVKEKSV